MAYRNELCAPSPEIIEADVFLKPKEEAKEPLSNIKVFRKTRIIKLKG